MNNKMILLVEDNPDDVALTKRALEKHNVANAVVVARDGVEALKYLFGNGDGAQCEDEDLPVLVLLDLKMPKVGGLEVLERIRADKRTKLLPVIILTSSKQQDDIVQSYEKGANSYVRKPVDFNEFTTAVKKLGVYWLLLNEPPPV